MKMFSEELNSRIRRYQKTIANCSRRLTKVFDNLRKNVKHHSSQIFEKKKPEADPQNSLCSLEEKEFIVEADPQNSNVDLNNNEYVCSLEEKEFIVEKTPNNFRSLNEKRKRLPVLLKKASQLSGSVADTKQQISIASEPRRFAPLTALRYLDLSHNGISFISLGFFDELTLLEHLDLSFNKLKNIYKYMFAKNIELRTLILSRNDISFIEAGSFDGLINLINFDISNNCIVQIPIIKKATLAKSETVSFSTSSLNLKEDVNEKDVKEICRICRSYSVKVDSNIDEWSSSNTSN